MTERTRQKTTGKRKAKARQAKRAGMLKARHSPAAAVVVGVTAPASGPGSMSRALDIPILAAHQHPATGDRAMLARLEAGFEALVAEMQSSTARAGTDRAFRATPGTIATAAVRAARTKRGGK